MSLNEFKEADIIKENIIGIATIEGLNQSIILKVYHRKALILLILKFVFVKLIKMKNGTL